MALNIKNERVQSLAREAARRTGRSQTSAIQLALESLLADLDQQQPDTHLDDLLAGLQRDVDGRLTTEDLYDEAGLPR